MTIPACRASRSASPVFPAAVGPQMTRMGAALLSAKAALELGPRELHDRGSAMHVVRGRLRVAERDEECTHLAGRQLVTRLDRRLARDGRRKSLVTRMRRRVAVAGERRERLAQTAFGVEAWMRHRH